MGSKEVAQLVLNAAKAFSGDYLLEDSVQGVHVFIAKGGERGRVEFGFR